MTDFRTATSTLLPPTPGLPDPDTQPGFYDDVPTKRLVAWAIDAVLIGLISVVLVPFTFFTAIFFFPVLFLTVGFVYRWATLARRSATPGMRVAAIDLRGPDGAPLDPGQAFLHTAGYTLSVTVFPLQLVSIGLMLATPRRQGLTDHVLGTAALNRAARS
ncbi:RDD family protein [Rhodobacteraceae bacterium CCMM004]|nr:RDD family protein [Rhodobacteraceae bacterium CCMM004]